MSEREQFEAALAEKPEVRFWNTTDAMFWAWQASRAQPAQAGQVLTDEEIDDVQRQTNAAYYAGTLQDRQHSRAIEQAVLAKRVPMTDPQLQTSEERRATGDRILELIEKQHPGIVGEKGGA